MEAFIREQFSLMPKNVEALIAEAAKVPSRRMIQNQQQIEQDEVLSEKSLEELDEMLREHLRKAACLCTMPQARTPFTCRKLLLHHQQLALGRLKQWHDDKSVTGGILGDDMGLGKTLDIIAFLLDRPPTCNRPALIVVPAGLMGNWEAEFKKWAIGDDLKVLFIHNEYQFASKMRELDALFVRKHNVIVVSKNAFANEASDKRPVKPHPTDDMLLGFLNPSM